MKVVFLSNYFNHHQQFFSDAMYRLIGEDYTFIETSEMREERKKLGYGISVFPPYVKQLYKSPDELNECVKLINDADVVVAGSAPEKFLKHRKRSNKLIFRYQERSLKQDLNLKQKLKRIVAFLIRNPKNKEIYLLCASAYASADYKKIGLFKDKAYKWGYFPNFKEHSIESLLAQKPKNRILWCGRFIWWKHPEYALHIASRLKNEGYDFSIDIVGTGSMEEELKREAEKKGLEECVNFIGAMKPEQVREQMEKASIFMFTSNFEEGWGAVLNEAMNSGCAVVASHAAGSVPYLLEDNANGLIFENGNVDDLYNKIKFLLDNPEEQKTLGAKAYRTIAEMWNPKVAAERFLAVVKAIKESGNCKLFCDGPCSKAEIITNNWFGGHNNEFIN